MDPFAAHPAISSGQAMSLDLPVAGRPGNCRGRKKTGVCGMPHLYNFFCFSKMGLFQNPAGFAPGSWKNRAKPGFSAQFKEAVPKMKFGTVSLALYF
jgi:hypothetical protein